MTQSSSAPTPVGPEHPVKLISLAVHSASANHWGRPWRRRTLSVMYPRELTFKGIRLSTQQMQSWLNLLARAGVLKRRKAEPAGSRQSEAAKHAPPPVETPQAGSALADLAFEWSSEMIPDFAQFARLSRLKREQERAAVDGSEELSGSTGDQELFDGMPSDADAILSGASMDAVPSEVLDADFLDPTNSAVQQGDKVVEAEPAQHAEGTAAEPVAPQGSEGTVAAGLQAAELPSAADDDSTPVSESVPMQSTIGIELADSVASTEVESIESIAADASKQVVDDESTAIETPEPLLPEQEAATERQPAITTVHESTEAEPVASTSEPTATPVWQDSEKAASVPSVETVLLASVEQAEPDAPGTLEPVKTQQSETAAHEGSAVYEPSLECQPTEVSVGVDLAEQIDDEHLELLLPLQDSSEPSEIPVGEAISADIPNELEQQEFVEQRVEQIEKSPEPDGVQASLHEGAMDVEPLLIHVVEPIASLEPEVATSILAVDLEPLEEAAPAVQVAAESAELFEPERDVPVETSIFQEALASGSQSEHLMAEPGVSDSSTAHAEVALEPIIASLEDALATLAVSDPTHDQIYSQPRGRIGERSEFVGIGSIDVATARYTQSTVSLAAPAVEAKPLADNYLEAAVLQGIFIHKETEMTHVHNEMAEADVQETAAPVTSVELQEVSAVLNVPQLEADPEDVLSDVQSTLNSLAGMAQGLTQQKQAAGRLQEELEHWNNQLQERERLAADKEERLQQLENHLKEAKTNLDRMAAENNRLLAERSEALKELAQTVDMRDKTTLKRAESIQLEQQRIDEHSASLRGRASELDERESALKRKTDELAVRLKQLQSAKDKFSTIVKSFNETVQFNSTLSAISKTVTE